MNNTINIKGKDRLTHLQHFLIYQIASTLLLLILGCGGLFFSAKKSKLFGILFLCAYLIISLFLFGVFRLRIYNTFLSLLTEQTQLTDTLSELQSQLATSETTNRNLSKAFETARPTIYQTALHRLLTASVDSETERNYLQHLLKLNDSSLTFYVMYGIVYENSTAETPENATVSSDSSEWLKVVTDSIEKNFSYNGICYYFSPMERRYTIVIPFSGNADSALIRIQEKVIHLHNQLLESHSIWFFTGLGQPCEFHQLWTTYEQARQMSTYTAKNYIFLPYEMMRKNSQAYYYPAKFSTQLTHFISTGKKEQISELFTLIHKENMDERSISVQLLRFLLTDIRNTILRARFQLEDVSVSCEKDLKKAEILLEEEQLSFHSLEESALLLASICAPKETDSNIMDTIVSYIQENYQDPSLGLSKISNEFHISESYFSHMFKDFVGLNFCSYLEQLRLSKASQLLQEGESDLNEIATIIGYNSAASFRRAFKKKYGVTPSTLLKK